MRTEKISPAGMNMLKRLAFNPVTEAEDSDRVASAIQSLINARAICGYGVPEGFRWHIYEAGWKALGADAETVRRKTAEQDAFTLKWRQAIEERSGMAAQYDLFGAAA